MTKVLPTSTNQSVGVLRGIGRTREEGGIDYDALGKIQLAVQVLYITSAALVKLSILFLYRQVFQHMRTIINITIAAIVIITVVFTFVAIFQCHPIGRFWFEPKAAQGACISHLIFWCDVAVVFLLSNIWITALPIRDSPAVMLNGPTDVFDGNDSPGLRRQALQGQRSDERHSPDLLLLHCGDMRCSGLFEYTISAFGRAAKMDKPGPMLILRLGCITSR
ncbi:hypothetical protein BO82DRAFT_398134 [Aspergillus uvarum CBS 121591]|uniref:Rhodopsin domain-containing protein n=1 Tax=Aspergillus uvarum CBS 121591 TaxID=1448315 RepID=A0A319D464_9EURO|nr:hypothetical protein BO82DRAFT_398134 [Aspergillus uvarum CBS 121591]PYH85813.1 hypothetical protein BO82DRAFT_398134 [Aspergillus uvarum CBS 121591]